MLTDERIRDIGLEHFAEHLIHGTALMVGMIDVFPKAMTFARAIEAESRTEAQEPFDMDWPDYHAEAMGCGLEDRGIHDRYDAMRYGWDEAIERCAERLPVLYTAPQPPALRNDYGTCDECGSPYSYDPRDGGSICVPCMMRKNAELRAEAAGRPSAADYVEQRDLSIALRARVGELERSISTDTETIIRLHEKVAEFEKAVALYDENGRQFGAIQVRDKQTIAQQAERIAELESEIKDSDRAYEVLDEQRNRRTDEIWALSATIKEQAALIDNCEKDAARYQYFRSSAAAAMYLNSTDEKLDFAIDAAIAAQKS